ncbi:hypothetical protein SUGI_0300320 [Cryptomeria japonica]|uniref:uncharacterized protein LOC131074897 n=1 Tax=Cryptomeria japonica TaxID=3369 RepID=UPI002408F037|nr:uncharacterized protein LOC131074897 [Cryptomeria japonica]GLJ17301.1 hypothetical protein SUGI_0300320 [Cryptomeria japonica]
MGWHPETAINAYLDTIKMRTERKSTFLEITEPQSSEFISALAAGMNAQNIIEVCSCAAASTVALANAAHHTGGHLVCILPEDETLTELQKTIKELGLEDTTEFVRGDAQHLLPIYKDIDFAVIDCNTKDYGGLFQHLNVNPTRAVVIAHKLFDRKANFAFPEGFKRKLGAQSTTLPIGKGIEITRIGNAIIHKCTSTKTKIP